MPFDNNTMQGRCSLVDALCENQDSVVTLYTDCACFTGLLVGLTNDLVKLITRCAPGCPGRGCFGKVTIIPLSEIQAVTFCNTSL